MPRYEYRCESGHFTEYFQKFSQGKPPIHLEECSGVMPSTIEYPSGERTEAHRCELRPKRFYGPVPFVMR